MTLLVMGVPTWTREMLVRARWIAVAVLLACLGIVLSERITRFQKIPFVLFIAVDAGLFLLLALCFKPPLRAIIISSGILGIIVGGSLVYRDTQLNPDRYTRDAGAAVEIPNERSKPLPLIEEVDQVVDFYAGTITYYMPLSVIIDVASPPDFDAICDAAEVAYDQALIDTPPPEARSKPLSQPRVKFLAQAAFDPTPNIYYPSGEAYTTGNGLWICQPAFPVNPEER
ncbi:MAG: hypothetical protein ISP91_12075 [Pseudomonadales bacterium]|jgi:hypothetical protein|nr:hypothetical protein [Pseudomonadales bacterium]